MAAFNWFGSAKRHAKRRPDPKRRSLRPRLSLEGLETRQLMAADLYVSNAGDDWSSGSVDAPFLTIRRALDAAQPGDTITLRNGIYDGGFTIDKNNLTIRSAPGEWAVIESPLTLLDDGRANSVIRYNFDVTAGKLENLEIAGGYYYGVMMWDWWDSDFSAGSHHFGASGITLDGVKVHDTGADAIKITPGADNIAILNSEVYHSGRRTATSSDGIDNNNGDNMVVRNTYVHDVPGIGILTSGGTANSVIEQNLVKNTGGAGIVAGYYSELEWLEPAQNPGHYAAINPIVRNNIVVDAAHAGVGIYGADGAKVYNNTLVNDAAIAQASIQFGGYEMWVSNTAPSYEHIASRDPVVMNNLVVTNSDNLARMVDIREGSITGQLTLDYNQYYHIGNPGGSLFIDRNLTGDSTPEQSFSAWKANYGYDRHSIVADPKLSTDWHLTSLSPAIGQAFPLVGLLQDYDGNTREDGQPDIGADEFGAGAKAATPPASFGAPSLEMANANYHDLEGNTVGLKVVRQGSASSTVTVRYATLAGTATAGDDFMAVAGTLTFAPGETEKYVQVALQGDDAAEGDEHFTLVLSAPTTDGAYPVRLGHLNSASVTIDDQDTPAVANYGTKWVSPGGSDVSGDGSQARPWKSLQYAADHVMAGDYVIVMPGQYWGMNLATDGKPDARITFHAMPGAEIDEPYPGQLDGINLEAADFVTIEGFYVHDMPRAGMRSVNNDGVILRNNRIDHNAKWGILTGWSENITVESNEVSRSQIEHGIYISNSSDGAVVRNNVVWGNNDSGIQFNADSRQPGDGIHSNNLIEGNVVYGNGVGGGAALNFDGLQDSVIRNNLLYDNHATGIVLYVHDAAGASKNNVLSNNTVVQPADGRWALLLANGSDGNVVTNNILLNLNPNRGSVTVDSNSLPSLSDHNIVSSLFQINGYNGSFAQWQSLSGGQDANSIVVPQSSMLAAAQSLFVNAAAGDFHLKAGAAAIDAGESANAPATDLYGHARPTGAGVDIGAFEAGQFATSVQFQSANWIGYERSGLAEITLIRSGDTEGTLAVDVFTSAGTATAGDDFQPLSTQVTFLPGEASRTVFVLVHDDSDIESLETVGLNLVVANGAGPQPANHSATLHIQSDDAWLPGAFQFGSPTVSVSEAEGTATITVHRVGGSSGMATVDYATAPWVKPRQATWIKSQTELLYPTDNDTPATAGADYVSQSGSLTFADGETEKTITLSIVNDAWYEAGEAFSVVLTSATGGATVGTKSNLKVHIDSDDVKQAGTFVWSASAYSVVEGTPAVNVTVNRINGGNVAASVRLYDTGAGNGNTIASAWAPTDYAFPPAELFFAAGEMSKTIAIPIVDDTMTEIDEAFSISLYGPTNDATIGGLGTTVVTIQDNESTIAFQYPNGQWSYSVMENGGAVPVTVVRQGSLAASASVRLATSGATAISGVDFIPIDTTVTFAPGESTKTINVPIINDSMVEPTESFTVNMSNVVGATQGSSSVSVNILNDDVAASPGKLQLSAAAYSVSEAGGAVSITVVRVDGSDGTVSVQYSTSDGATGNPNTAWSGADYSGKSGTLTFAPGETVKTFTIPITNDTSVEKDEVFTVTLKNAAGGATLGATAKAVVTILEDDSSIDFAQTNYVVGESAGVMQLRIRRNGSVSGMATVDLNIVNGTAIAGLDFMKPANKTVTFADGEYEKLVDIAIIDDLLQEADESFNLSLANAVGAKLGSYLYGTGKILAND